MAGLDDKKIVAELREVRLAIDRLTEVIATIGRVSDLPGAQVIQMPGRGGSR